jgi:hypothetical protein
MKKYSFAVLIVSIFIFENIAHSSVGDTLIQAKKKNIIEIEFLGNNYISPFFSFLGSDYGISPASLNYKRTIFRSNSCWQFNLGLGSFRSYYVENQTYHKPWALTVPLGFLWRPNYKRNGFWVGLFYTSSFVRQDYEVIIDRYSSINYTIYYDYQVMPNICYQLHSKKGSFVCNFSFTPKLSSGFSTDKKGYEWKALPLWGGISIGGAW